MFAKLETLARLVMANLQPHSAVGQLAVRAAVIDLQACSRAQQCEFTYTAEPPTSALLLKGNRVQHKHAACKHVHADASSEDAPRVSR